MRRGDGDAVIACGDAPWAQRRTLRTADGPQSKAHPLPASPYPILLILQA